MLKEVEKRNGKKIYTILQLRLHPSIIALKKERSLMNWVLLLVGVGGFIIDLFIVINVYL